MTLLLLQIALILLVTIACGAIARRLGQARVIGEIVGGILLGPSIFGRLAPDLSSLIFNKTSMATFDSLSTIGLVLFMFLVGMDLDYEQLYKQRGTASLASALSICLPFAMGAFLAEPLRIRFAPPGAAALPFALFLGIAMSITAFPVLARILEERGLHTTSLGTTAILCAAVDDVVAWLLLAVAMAMIGKGDGPASVPVRLAILLAYVVLMIGVIRPLAKWLAKRQRAAGLSPEFLSVLVASTLLSAAATDAMGVHPLFGAFLAGICFPRIPRWQTAIKQQLDMLTNVLLLPLFFALTGLRTQLNLLSSAETWWWAAVVLLVAVAGKMGGAVLAARWTGQSWQEALALGALLNSRGLVELIVLNVAYNAGVFSPTLFTMLVIMALATTVLTTPLLNWLGVDNRAKAQSDTVSANAAA